MEQPIATVVAALIAAFVGVIGGAFLTYWATRRREIELEWRKQRSLYYKEYLSAYAGIVCNNDVPKPGVEARLRYEAAFNTIGLFASLEFIKKAQELQKHIEGDVSDSDLTAHDKMLVDLMASMRADLCMPKNEQKIPEYWLMVSGARKEK
jgi:hypothetical protein